MRNSIAQEKTMPDKTEKKTGTSVDFVEPQRKKQESTPLPLINSSIRSRMTKTATKGGVSNSTRIPRESGAHTSVTPDAMTWTNTWEMMIGHLKHSQRETQSRAMEEEVNREKA